jgi:hypothetical protein
MLIAYTKTGREVFELRDFLRDETIIYDQLNPNLNIRLQRLAKLLREECPAISLSRAERGKIQLKLSCKINYTEV